jgi:hypothetical protein
MSVRTCTYLYVPLPGMYRLVLLWCMYWYVLLVNFHMSVHTSTHLYVLVQTNDQSTYEKVSSTSKYFWQYKAIHVSTRQCMIVHFLVRTDSMLVRTGNKLHGCPAAFCTRNFALLKALISQTVQAETPVHSQSCLFICHFCQGP